MNFKNEQLSDERCPLDGAGELVLGTLHGADADVVRDDRGLVSDHAVRRTVVVALFHCLSLLFETKSDTP